MTLANFKRTLAAWQRKLLWKQMADVFSKRKRSQVMAAIRSSGNKDTELKLAKLFRKHGITGWRRHQPVFGKPDFIFRRQKVAVFVDGCFWHGCPKHGIIPATHKAYWAKKIAKNKARDGRVNRGLRSNGWLVLRVWEHSLWFPNSVTRRVGSTLKNAIKDCNF